jgi:hypothetical protein
MLWARLPAYVTGRVDQELLLRNEYLAAENRILRGQIKRRLLLSEGEKATLAEIAHRLGRKGLEDVAATAKPATILGWYRKLIVNKFDGSKSRRRVGRPKLDQETERLVVPFASSLLQLFSSECLAVGSDYPMFEKDRYAAYMGLAIKWVYRTVPKWSPILESDCFSNHLPPSR